jgi:hypothetical protein
MSCLFRFNEIRFCYIFLQSRSLSFSLLVNNIVVRFFSLLLSLVYSTAVIIVIIEIYKFDDRPDNGASMQVYYRLSMCI